jgi:hypothetical protein
MSRLLILLLIVIVLGYLWYQWQARQAAERERSTRRQVDARAEEVRAPLPPLASEPASTGGLARAAERAGAAGAATLQNAADAAAELDLERAASELDTKTAELAASRREAEAAAARLRLDADDALAEVQDATNLDASAGGEVAEDVVETVDQGGGEVIEVDAMLIREREADARGDIVAEAIAAADAGSVPPGAIRGDGGRVCPPTYPIKGNEQSMLYHLPENPTYQSTVPELCFSTVEAAHAAGYSEARH